MQMNTAPARNPPSIQIRSWASGVKFPTNHSVNHVAAETTIQTGRWRKKTVHKSAVRTGPVCPTIKYQIGTRTNKL